MSASSPLLLPALLLLIVLVARARAAPGAEPTGATFGDQSWMPLAVGAIAAGLTAWIWGGLAAPAVVHDEAAYLLQAATFVRGHWALPSPPQFEAFTQAHVLVTPVLAAKYPPGHGLLLAIGVVLGLPGLIPVLLVATSAALLYVIVRRVWSAPVAVLAAALWLTQAGQSRWRASYFSENTTAALWLAGWYFLLRWRASRATGWLIALAIATGLGAITRPLTMLVFAVPVGVVVLSDLRRSREWRPLALAIIAGTIVLALLPVQNLEVLGNVRRSPLALYTRQYLPFDRVGFGVDTTLPELALPPDVKLGMADFIAVHRAYTLASLPRVLRDRLGRAWLTAFGGWRRVLVIAAVVGLIGLGAAGSLAAASTILLYLAYLLYAHDASWTLYYYEVTPFAALVVALGLECVLRRTGGRSGMAPWVPWVAAVVIMGMGFNDFSASRHFRAAEQRPFRQLNDAVAATGTRALVFVRYGPQHNSTVSLVRNVADPAIAPLITAYDRGPDVNHQLVAFFPDRVAYLWDEESHTLSRAW